VITVFDGRGWLTDFQSLLCSAFSWVTDFSLWQWN
jgi:hypothetical protein